MLLKAAAGRLEKAENFESLALEDFAIFSRRGARLSLDGEVVQMRPPYRYRIRPRALKVLRPHL
jgi:diacylglycerol kinase family enzyme